VEAAAPRIEDFKHGRVPRDVRERQLVELAEQLFAERGYAGASMEELCRRAGVTKPVVYELFGSKDGLYRRCLERSADQLASVVAEAVAGADDLEAKIRAGGAAFFGFAERHRVAWDILFLEPDGRFASEASEIRRRQASLVGRLLEEALPDADPAELDLVAHAINGAYEAVAGWATEHPEVPPDELAEHLIALLGPGLRRFT
jgi:AcrR family transcriptional regulator